MERCTPEIRPLLADELRDLHLRQPRERPVHALVEAPGLEGRPPDLVHPLLQEPGGANRPSQLRGVSLCFH